MLVVGRRRDEAIRIGDDVDVVVLSVRGGTVQLGISAPSEMLVLRSELIAKEKQDHGSESASQSAP